MKRRIKEGGDVEGMRVRKRKTAAWSFGARETDRHLLIYNCMEFGKRETDRRLLIYTLSSKHNQKRF